MRKAPRVPFIPTDWHDKHVMILAYCYCGPVSDGEAAAAPFRALGTPIVDLIGSQSFVDWQRALDPLLGPGARNYWKSHDLNEFSDAALAAIIEAIRRQPSDECQIAIAALGGQAGRVPADAMAYS